MNKKALALIIAGLVILVAIIYFIFIYDFGGNQNKPSTNTGTPTQTVNPATPIVSKSSPTPQATEKLSSADQSKETAIQLASSFAERYGTSSSQADFSNLTDAEVFMTDSFIATTNKFITTERNKPSDGAYKSIVTKTALVEFSTFNETAGTAQGLVKTKRLKTETDGKTSSYDQSLAISLKKVGSEWKVDSATWK